MALKRFVPLDRSALQKRYGAFFVVRTKVPLRVEHVPAAVRALIPYAEIWGVSDDVQRDELVDGAPKAARSDLIALIDTWNDEFDAWLAGPESYSTSPTIEYVAFSNL